jgi:hypothetical protein
MNSDDWKLVNAREYSVPEDSRLISGKRENAPRKWEPAQFFRNDREIVVSDSLNFL